MTEFITLPGIGGSGPEHWQTLWEKGEGRWRRFSPSSWDAPQLDDWCAALDCAAREAGAPPVLVAHSLACLLVAHWSARSTLPILGAFLVAVPDPAAAQFPRIEAASFVGAPDQRLRFPSMIIASRNDPYGSLTYQHERAAAWRSRFVDIGECGHINASSGVGAWPAGQRCLGEFVSTL